MMVYSYFKSFTIVWKIYILCVASFFHLYIILFYLVWDKVEAAVKDFSADVDEFVKAEIEKYKPRIIEALNEFRDDVEDYKDFVIDEAKKIHVRIDKFRVQIMEDANDG